MEKNILVIIKCKKFYHCKIREYFIIYIKFILTEFMNWNYETKNSNQLEVKMQIANILKNIIPEGFLQDLAGFASDFKKPVETAHNAANTVVSASNVANMFGLGNVVQALQGIASKVSSYTAQALPVLNTLASMRQAEQTQALEAETKPS